MKPARYIIPVVALLSLFLLLLYSVLFFFNLIEKEIYLSSLLGIAIPFLNFILGFLSIRYSLDRSHSAFLIIFLGGMMVRLLLMLTAVFLVLKFLENIAYSFIFIIFIFYSFYLLSEILYLNQLKNK